VLDRQLRDRGIAVHLNIKDFGDVQLLPEVEITLFRIIQEASMNIARHSGAENAFVTVRTRANDLFVTVEDDGEGFDTSTTFANTLTGRGLGIMGMKERASLLNGRLTVCSSPGAGTMVLCTIPLTAEV
jgi:signal transduction histidine kinase